MTCCHGGRCSENYGSQTPHCKRDNVSYAERVDDADKGLMYNDNAGLRRERKECNQVPAT
jgi:hypothetical protein